MHSGKINLNHVGLKNILVINSLLPLYPTSGVVGVIVVVVVVLVAVDGVPVGFCFCT